MKRGPYHLSTFERVTHEIKKVNWNLLQDPSIYPPKHFSTIEAERLADTSDFRVYQPGEIE